MANAPRWGLASVDQSSPHRLYDSSTSTRAAFASRAVCEVGVIIATCRKSIQSPVERAWSQPDRRPDAASTPVVFFRKLLRCTPLKSPFSIRLPNGGSESEMKLYARLNDTGGLCQGRRAEDRPWNSDPSSLVCSHSRL